MFPSIGDKLDLLMTKEGISGIKLARKVGLPASTVKKIRSKEIANPTLASLVPIARYFSVSLDYLLTEEINGQPPRPPEQHHELPLLNWESVVPWPEIKSTVEHTIVSELAYSEHAYALRVDTAEWIVFPEDTILLIDPAAIPTHQDYVVVSKNGQHTATLKQFLCEDDQAYLHSVSILNTSIPLTAEYRVLGVVMEYRRQLKTPLPKKISSPMQSTSQLIPDLSIEGE